MMSEYTDLKDNRYKIIEQPCVLTPEERERLQAEIVEDLYHIFMRS